MDCRGKTYIRAIRILIMSEDGATRKTLLLNPLAILCPIRKAAECLDRKSRRPQSVDRNWGFRHGGGISQGY
jgi:hypothetical protein